MDSIQSDIIKEIQKKGEQAGDVCKMLSFFIRNTATYQSSIVSSLSSLSSSFQKGKNICGHLHDGHFHGFSHDFTTDNVQVTNNGRKYYDITPTASEVLMKEQSDFQDFDNNGLIWCKDFCIDPYDSNAPLAVRRTQLNNPLYLKLTMMTWAEYLNTVSVHLPWKDRAKCIKG